MNKANIMIVAGEASGDSHAAKLVGAMRECSSDTEFAFFGSAGPKMRAAGVEATVRADDLSIMGIPEIARAFPTFLAAFRDLKNAAVERKADAAILVDFPEFNLKLAKALKKRGIKVIYYISPQLWAWRKYRLRTIRDHVDLLISILPFEKDWYALNGVHNVEYVGNPLAMEVHADLSKADFCARYGLRADKPIISLLPGSRRKEFAQILPIMLETAGLMVNRDSEAQFIVAAAPNRGESEVRAARLLVESSGKRLPHTLIAVQDDTYNALNASDAAAVASGTATLETGIIGTPMAVVYKASNLNYKLVRPLISVEHFGLINLIAGERIAAELIQEDFTPQKLADELFRLLEPAENMRVREKLKESVEKLGRGGASKRAADLILKTLDIMPKKS